SRTVSRLSKCGSQLRPIKPPRKPSRPPKCRKRCGSEAGDLRPGRKSGQYSCDHVSDHPLHRRLTVDHAVHATFSPPKPDNLIDLSVNEIQQQRAGLVHVRPAVVAATRSVLVVGVDPFLDARMVV